MATKVNMIHVQSGLTQQVPVGFSWTMMCWFPWPMAFRGKWMHFMIAMIAWILVLWMVFPIVMVVAGFTYNKWHARKLLTEGWVFDASDDNYEWACQKVGVAS